jgi:hypothetical protein
LNQHDSGRFCTESLESAAKRYKTLGFSIIPLLGARNPQQPKLPAIKWARFQHTHPSDDDLRTWFHGHDDAGIGIVCGRVSRLMVLDFDDAAVASEFRRLHPDLANTFTVRSGTRGLPHFYYRLPEGKLITTSAYPGADLRGEGAYVVAPPTRIQQLAWQVENDAPIHAISEFDLRRLMRFLAALKATAMQVSPSSVSVPTAQASEFRRLTSDVELIAHYQRLCGLGRNLALFKTAVMARDAGIPEATSCFVLAPVHGREPGADHEDYQARYAEAIRTIASAYKRPPRWTAKSSEIGLGNAVREWLLANNLVAFSRVVDGLYAVGVRPGEVFSEFKACQQLAQLKIGRRSIMVALKAGIAGKCVFESPLYPPEEANAAKGLGDLNNSCEMSRGAKRVKIVKRGRPARLYRLPSPDEIAGLIGLKSTASDRVIASDLCSPKAYRQALHKQLLDRRPGHYPRAWLGKRIGVSRWTTRRYEKAANLYVRPTYTIQTLTWLSAANLPQSSADTSYGTFLETSDRKRYPAVRGLAFKLLKQGREPVLKQQQSNYYAVSPLGVGIPTPQLQSNTESLGSLEIKLGDDSVLQNALGVGIPTASTYPSRAQQPKPTSKLLSVGIPTPQQAEPNFWLCPDCLDFHVAVDRPAPCTRCGCDKDWEIVPHVIWRDPQALKQWWQTRYREHQQIKQNQGQTLFTQQAMELPAEAKILAERVHAEIPNLSLSNARKIVWEFGRQLIEKALSVVRGRKGLRSPAGFLIAFLRSEQKLLLSNNKFKPECTPKPRGESAMEWVRQLAKSQYLSFITNADDILNLGLSNESSWA